MTLSKLELIIECSGCGKKLKKSFAWLRQKHLPCSGCGADFDVGENEIAYVEREMIKALRNVESIRDTSTITLKL